jgi:octaheme c-type cytochrome (tetrathionate reductase family)
MRTSHFLWLGEPVEVEGHEGSLRIGKRNLINNFCIGISGNWPSCTSCHAGYGWGDESFDFEDRDNVDCLVCHERTGTYVKGDAGLPGPEVDLVAAAKSVGFPRRENCGVCHNFGGGGVGVKHGDLDNSLNHPDEADDVHMGRLNFLCIDCHTTTEHRITGRSMSVSVDDKDGIGCADCHQGEPHEEPRLNAHLDSVSCEACHIPTFARTVPTKLRWDWSKVGDDSRPQDPHSYLKIKGEFVVGTDVVPQYFWFNGRSGRYLLGDAIDPGEVTPINYPLGNIDEPRARITPFKTHLAVQPFDAISRQLLSPLTSGEGGLWHTFDWNEALRLGAAKSGLSYSGRYGFASTVMYWPLSHMVAPKEQALRCDACHGEHSRLDWRALGYQFDPIDAGGR